MEGFNVDWFVVVSALLFVCFDFLTGIIKAIKNKIVSSTIMREGLLHKCAFVLVIVLAIMCEAAMTHLDLGITVPLVAPVCVYIILTEIASILENIAEINPELKDSKVFALFTSTKEENDA